MLKWMGWALVLALGLSAGALRADESLAAAQRNYQEGLAKMKAKDYANAIQDFQSALSYEPRYVYAWKQIGTCSYYLDDKPGAVEAYDKYLAVYTNDPQTKAFADKLRAQLPSAEGPPPEKWVKRRTKEKGVFLGGQPTWRIGASFGAGTVSFKAYNDDWKDVGMSGTGTPPSIDSQISVGLVAGYRIIPPLEIGLDLDYALLSTEYSITYAFSTAKSTGKDTFDALWVGPRVQYDFLMKRRFNLGVNLGVGYLTLMGAGEEFKTVSGSGVTTYAYNSTLSGSTVGFKGGLNTVMRLGQRLSWTMDLGYRVATMGTVTESWKAVSGSSSATGTRNLQRFGTTSGNMSLDYSGLDVKAALNLTF